MLGGRGVDKVMVVISRMSLRLLLSPELLWCKVENKGVCQVCWGYYCLLALFEGGEWSERAR